MKGHIISAPIMVVALAVLILTHVVNGLLALSAQVISSNHRSPVIEDAVALKSPGGVAASPDGALIAIEIAGGISIIQIAEPGRVKYEVKGSWPSWSPNGGLLAFVAGSDGNAQINLWNRNTGIVEVVTDFPGGIMPAGALAWSPDSKSIAFCSRELGPDVLRSDSPPRIKVLTTDTSHDLVMEGLFRHDSVESFAASSLASKRWRTIRLDPKTGLNKLFVVDLCSHQLRRLTQKDQHFSPSWSPDGRKIACISDSTMGVYISGPAETQLAIFDVATGNEHRLTSLRAFNGKPQWSPDGTQIADIGDRQRIGFSDIQLLSVPDGRWSIVKTPKAMKPNDVRWTRDGTTILGKMADRFADTLWTIDVSTGASSRINTGEQDVANFDMTSSGDIIFSASDSYHQGRIYLRRHDAADRLDLLFDPNAQLANLTLGEQRRVTWKNKVGEEVDGIIILPPNYEPGRRYPVIVDPYPRPARDNLKLSIGADMGQIEAALGYIVFIPGVRAPHAPYAFSREAEYTERAVGAKGIPIMVDDYESGIEFLARSGLIDRDRIGLFGQSNGAGVANFLITEAKPGKCAVLSSVAWGDAFFDDFMLSEWSPHHSHMSRYVDGDMYNNIQDYIKLSPIFKLNRVNVPILMLGGDKDWYAVMLMTMEFNALRHLGKEVTFVRYAEEGHVVAKIENQRDWRDRVHRFFDEHLKQ